MLIISSLMYVFILCLRIGNITLQYSLLRRLHPFSISHAEKRMTLKDCVEPGDKATLQYNY